VSVNPRSCLAQSRTPEATANAERGGVTRFAPLSLVKLGDCKFFLKPFVVLKLGSGDFDSHRCSRPRALKGTPPGGQDVRAARRRGAAGLRARAADTRACETRGVWGQGAAASGLTTRRPLRSSPAAVSESAAVAGRDESSR
jgi:hypothetical protein